jgi:predicted ATP-dependent endonuclease of OLD family
MRITRVQIRNWRSIKDVDFYPSDITVLVGPNNAGKTNILSAINFIMGDRWPMPANLADQDFYAGDRTRDVYIGLHLDHPSYSFLEFDTSKPPIEKRLLSHMSMRPAASTVNSAFHVGPCSARPFGISTTI